MSRRRCHPMLASKLECLEERVVLSAISIQADQIVRGLSGNLAAVNLAGYDGRLASDDSNPTDTTPDPGSLQLLQQSGMRMFRLSNGSGTDEDWHFDEESDDFTSGVGLLSNISEEVGAEVMFCVNYGTGSPQESAAYLAYLNGDINNNFAIGEDADGKDWQTVGFWAGLRGAAPLGVDDGYNHLRTGHAAPYGFTYLEVGNEAYFQAWKGYIEPTLQDVQDYADYVTALAGLADHIDATIKIGIGVGNPGEWDDIWNAPLLDDLANADYAPGFLSDHFYIDDGTPEGDQLTDFNLLNHSVSDPNSTMPIHGDSPRNWAGRAAAYRALLTDHLGAAGDSVELQVGEFNSDSNASTRQTTALTNGLLFADAIGSIMQTEYNSLIVWNFRNAYTPVPGRSGISGWRTGGNDGIVGDTGFNSPGIDPPANGPYIAYPTFHAEELASMLGTWGDNVVTASSDTSSVAAYATARSDGHLEILLINKSSTTADTAAFSITGYAPDTHANEWLYGKTEDDAQRDSADGASSLTHLSPILNLGIDGGATTFTLSLPAYSMQILDLTPGETVGSPVEVIGDTVTVTGTGNADTITVTPGATYTVMFNNTNYSFNPVGITHIIINAGGGDDAVTVLGTSIATTVNGGVGSDRLTGPNSVSTWTINGANSGNIGNVIAFSGVESLTGGTATDVFQFTEGAVISGLVSGGDTLNDDWLDFSACTTSVTVNLSTFTASHTGSIRNFRNVRGGSADDVLTGSSGTILIGSGGNDTLTGVGGRNILIGGTGSDQLVGGSGDEILIGGTTDFDNNAAVLVSLLAEWSAKGSRAKRLQHLRQGGGLNGGNKLIAATTVHDDNEPNNLTGNKGTDWYFQGLADVVHGRKKKEPLN